MRTNGILLGIAMMLIIIVLARTGILQDRRLLNCTPMAIIAMALYVLCYRIGGISLVTSSLSKAWTFGALMGPNFLATFAAAGAASMLAVLYRDALLDFLDGTFWHSLLIMHVVPGGVTVVPTIRELWETSVNRPQLLAVLVGAHTLNWQVSLLPLPLLGWQLTAYVYVVKLVLMLLLLLVVYGYGKISP